VAGNFWQALPATGREPHGALRHQVASDEGPRYLHAVMVISPDTVYAVSATLL